MQTMLLRDNALVEHCKKIGNPLPVSISLLQKDRMHSNNNPLGIPFRKIGGGIFYDPDTVLQFFAGLPIIRPQKIAFKPTTGLKRGKPTKEETIDARKFGVTVPELRAERALKGEVRNER